MPNNEELELERKRQEQLRRERSREDEMERERTIDGEEIYVPDEDKKPVEEEEYDASLDDNKPDEYYEDMFEEDWEEIEAAEAANKEKQERLARIKAKRKEREKKLKSQRDEENRKAAERLAEQRRREEQSKQLQTTPVAPIPTPSAETPVAAPLASEQPSHESVVENVTHEEPVARHEVPTYSNYEPVEIENGNFKSQVGYVEQEKPREVEKAHEVEKSREAEIRQEQSRESVTPIITPTQVETPTPTPTRVEPVAENKVTDVSSGSKEIPYVDMGYRPTPTTPEYSGISGGAGYQEPVREAAKETERPIENKPVQETEKPTYTIPVHHENVVEQGAQTANTSQTQSVESPRIEIHDTEYSREHKKEMWEQTQQESATPGVTPSDSVKNATVKSGTDFEQPRPEFYVSGAQKQEAMHQQQQMQEETPIHSAGVTGAEAFVQEHTHGVVNQNAGPVVGATPKTDESTKKPDLSSAEYSRNHRNEQAAAMEAERRADVMGTGATQEGAAKQSNNEKDTQSSPIVGLKQDGKPGDAPIGVAKNDLISGDGIGFRGVSEAERPHYSEIGIPLSVVTAASAMSPEAGMNIAGAHAFGAAAGQAVEQGATATVGKAAEKASSSISSMPDYMRAAKSVLVNYEKESISLNEKIMSGREKLRALQDKGGNAAEIAAVRADIKANSDRLKLISADKARVSDFLDNGARSMSHITKDDVMNAKYSRAHAADMRDKMQGGPDIAGATGGIEGSGKKMFYSSSNLKHLHRKRLTQVLGTMGGKVWDGTKSGFKRVLREDEDLDTEVETVDTALDIRRIVSMHVSTVYVGRELKHLGLGHDAIRQQLKEMGVVVGVGDVSKMKLKELQDLLLTQEFSPAVTQQIEQAIELKKRLKMGNFKLADLYIKEAGEYINWSRRKLMKELKEGGLDIVKKKQIEAALRYKKLNKYSRWAQARWKTTFRLFGGLSERVLRNNEHLSDAVGLGHNAATAYKATRAIARGGATAVKKTAETGRKLASGAKKTIVGLKNRAELIGKNKVLQTQGMRKANLIGKAKPTAAKRFGSKGAKSFAEWAKNAWSTLKNGAVAAAKGIVAGIKGLIGVIAGGGGGFLLIMILFLLIAGIFCAMFFYIFGDKKNGTSVPEMVQYLNDKNTAWLQTIEEKEEGQPRQKDIDGNVLDAYTKVTYTYLDEDGEKCFVTNNTKELVSMAAVYFYQDFSEADPIYEYLDKMWDASHALAVSEGDLRGCDGETCLDADGNQTDIKGSNSEIIKYSCTDRYDRIIRTNCFPIQSEHERRVEEMQNSGYRFTSATAAISKYRGIADMRTESTHTSYGCSLKSGTFSCEDIRSITNGEVLVYMVNRTGIDYQTLYDLEGCAIKHSGTSEGAPHSGCRDYDEHLIYYTLDYATLPKDDSIYKFVWDSDKGVYSYTHSNGTTYNFSISKGHFDNVYEIPVWYSSSRDCFIFAISYFTCDEYVCKGHDQTYTYHYCPGEHEEIVCNGHVDLKINISVTAFDKLYEVEVYDLPFGHRHQGGTVDTSKICTHNNQEYIAFDADGAPIEKLCLDCNAYFKNDAWDYTNSTHEVPDFEWDRAPNFNVWVPEDIKWCTTIYNQDWAQLYGVIIRSNLFFESDRVMNVEWPTNASALQIPWINQLDFPNAPYGSYGTVASHGCGLTCIAMLDSYYKDKLTSPAELARFYGNYNTEHGSYWSLIPDAAADLMLPYEGETSSWAEVVQALSEGKPVISIQNENGIFTNGGHFIILSGVTSDGKILVTDPNGANWYKNETMIDGFANGFSQIQVQAGSSGTYWIFGAKPAPEEPEA